MEPPDDITEFQRRRRLGETSAEDRVRKYLQRIESLNPSLNAFVAIDAEGARAAAEESDLRLRRGAALGPIDGIALAAKDNIDVAGLPAAAGMGALRGRRAERDALCIERARAAGALVLGKTHMDEAAISALGENPWFGRCHNPRRFGHTPGGSSSGSAAAVAAGLCAAALGTDTLGSVRIPASYCGVVGFIPSAGLIELQGVAPLAPRFDRIGVLACSVADAGCVAQALLRDHPIVPDSGRKARVGVVRGYEPLTAPEIVLAIRSAGRLLAPGNELVDIDASDFDWGGVRRAAFLLVEAAAAQIYAALLEDRSSGLSPALRGALEFGRSAGADRIAKASARVEEGRARLQRMLSLCEVLLLPSTPQTSFAFGSAVPPGQADLTAPANIAGLPAISVPARNGEALPVGVQLLAANGNDALLLGLASRLG